MAGPSTRVVLVSRNDRGWISSCEKALRARGIEIAQAHNCWSADVAQGLHGGEAVVIDGNILCGFVSADRPGPVLGFSPELPVLVFNAEGLDEQHRSAAMAHDALMVEGDDVAEIARCVADVLPPS